MVVVLSTATSIMGGSVLVVVSIIGILLVISGAAVVVELMSELEDDT
jgi:hypothetical protein